MGNKYIIELPENTHWIQWILESTEDHHPYMDFRHVEDLTPYTEPDLEQVRKEAYEEGYKKCLSLNNFGHLCVSCDKYEQGLADAWEAARKIAYMYSEERKKIFGENLIQNIHDIYSASEAIEKIRQYEQVKNELDHEGENIQVGDEVISPDGKGVVTEITDIYMRIMYAKGSGQVVKSEDLTKTGRHFPEIAEVLAKMKESDNG